MLIRFMQGFWDGAELHKRSLRFGEEWPNEDFDKLPSSVLVKLDSGWVKKGSIAGDKELEDELKKALKAKPAKAEPEQASLEL